MRCPKSFLRLVFDLAFLAAALLVPARCAIAQQETVLHSFNPGIREGLNPQSNLIFDASGNLYGTTFNGGIYGCGTAFELSPTAKGGWTEKTLHNFCKGGDGSNSAAGMILDSAGNLYGTTVYGGA